MNSLTFNMNLYFDPNYIINEKINIKESVINRIQVTDKQDIFNAIDFYYDTFDFITLEESNYLSVFINDLDVEDIAPYLTIDENSLIYDIYESGELDFKTIAYKLNVTLDVEALMEQYQGKDNIEGKDNIDLE